MRVETPLSLSTLYGFLLVLTRVAGAFVWVPLPGMRNASETGRLMLALGITVALFPQWPAVGVPTLGQLTGWMLGEAALGTGIGLAVAFVLEAFVLGAQITALQAGYGYASTIDPDTQADSGVLLVLAQLTAGLLFFAVGLDRAVIRTLADSLRTHPAGSFLLTRPTVEHVARLGGDMFSTGLRLAMPAVGLLLLIDVALALFGRVHAQMQLLTLAFPLKMLVALGLLVSTAALWPALLRDMAGPLAGVFRMVLEP